MLNLEDDCFKKMPELLFKRLDEQYDSTIINNILLAFCKRKKTTLRVNNLKSNLENVCKVLSEENISFEKVGWSKDALILDNVNEEIVKKLTIYENGDIYLQSLSSMLPPIILEPKVGKDILDMAAAPGGKTTQIASLTLNKAHITACEINNIRRERLEYNLKKQGVTCTAIMKVDARNLDDFFSFDQILLDSPCSGSGTIFLSQDENRKILFTNDFENKLEKTQLLLLEKAVKLLKKGSEMVYSTCSILYKENENIVLKVLNKHNDIELVPISFEGIEQIEKLPTKLEGCLLVAPNELYEGFFVAKLRKKRISGYISGLYEN